MDLFGIDHSRAVYGNVAARIVHIPEGQPCGEAYAVSQVRSSWTMGRGGEGQPCGEACAVSQVGPAPVPLPPLFLAPIIEH